MVGFRFFVVVWLHTGELGVVFRGVYCCFCCVVLSLIGWC